MHPDTVVSVLGTLFIGVLIGMFVDSHGKPATAALPAAPVVEQPSPLSEPLTTPLTRAVYLDREPCECARYRMVSLPGTDHTAVLRIGGELPTGQGGIAQPELPQ